MRDEKLNEREDDGLELSPQTNVKLIFMAGFIVLLLIILAFTGVIR